MRSLHGSCLGVRTKVSRCGQASIPAPVRRPLHIEAGTTLEWVVEGTTVRVIPIPADPLAAFRGAGRGGTVKQLLRDRRRERARDA